MNNKGVGAVFCLIAALLTAAHYLSAALFMSSIGTWSADLFQSSLKYVGPVLPIAAILSLIVGVVFLGVGVAQDGKAAKKE